MLPKRLLRDWLRVAAFLAVFLSGSLFPAGLLKGSLTPSVNADATPQTLPFSQDWSTVGLITMDDMWGGVPGIIGFRGDGLTGATGVDPQTVVADGSATPVDVNANRSDPNTFTTGGVTEFDGIANPVVALQGSGTARAPHLVIHLNLTGISGAKITYNLRDIDGSADNSVQPVALQYRVGGAGNYTNIPAGFVADASSGPSMATLVTPVNVTLPAATDNQALVQLRIITTDAVGSDEWIGIDDIVVLVPSEAKLDSFTANRYAGGKVLVEWHTGFEVDNLGFNVYREVNGNRVRMNPQILAGSALTIGEGTKLKSGYSYAWADKVPRAKAATYWLESIDLSVQSILFGPVSVGEAESQDGLPREQGRAMLLANLGKSSAPSASTMPVTRASGTPQITAAGLSAQSSIAAGPALKLSINQEGWYRVSAQELIDAGLDSKTDPRTLQLFVDGEEQSCIVTGESDGRFDQSDTLEFYGVGLNTAFTNTRVYWLVAGSQQGRRIEQINGKGSRSAPGNFPYTVERKERTTYFSGLRNGDAENFFGAVIARDPVDQTMVVQHVDKAAQGDAAIEVALQGVTAVAHRISVELNGTAVGEVSLWGQSHGVATLSLSPAALKEGSNTFRLTPKAGESDVTLVDYIRLTYPHTYTADNNALQFSLAKKQQVRIGGFNSAGIRVLDITVPNDVREVSSRVERQGEGYAVTVNAPKGGLRTLWALADDHATRAAAITPNRLSNLRDEGRAADLVIIAHRDFLDRVNVLKSLRESQGLSVTVVDIEDIYDEFSYGHKSPKAIKDFLAFTNMSWQKRPRFALFVGDATFDPKNYLGRGDHDFIPTRLVDTLFLETASDDWFGDFNEDGLAEMALGRLPVRTADETSRIIGKIVSYESAARAQSVMLVSDLNDGIDFRTTHTQLRGLIPAGVTVEEIDRGQMGTAAAKSRLIDSLNLGLGVVSYYGHGNLDQWRGNLLTSADASGLANGRMLPVFFTMTCLNGYFVDPALDSLAESLLKAERGGAVAVWASTGMCDAVPQAMLEQEMFRLLFAGNSSGGDALTLGEAALKAKESIKDTDVRLSYILFGDPSGRLR